MVNFLFENGTVESKTCKQCGRHYSPFAIEILRYGTRDHTGNFFLKTSWQEQIHIWLTRYSGLFIFPIYLPDYIIREHTRKYFRKTSWPGADNIYDSEAEQKDNIIVEDKK